MTFTDSTLVAAAAAPAVTEAAAPVTPKPAAPAAPKVEFDLSVFKAAAAAEVQSLASFDAMRAEMASWHEAGVYPAPEDLADAIGLGFASNPFVGSPSKASLKQYAYGILKFAKAGEWPSGTVRSFGAFQKNSPKKGSGKGRPKSEAAETPATETPAASQVWKGLMPLLTQVRNGADIGIAWQETDKAQAAELARQLMALIGQYVKA